MPPTAPKRMTANPVRPERHRAGKILREEAESSSSEEESDEEELQKSSKAPPPKATSYPAYAKVINTAPITSSLQNVDIEERRRRAQAKEKQNQAKKAAKLEKLAADAGWVTASEESSEEAEDEDQDDSEADSKPTRYAPSGPISSSRAQRPENSSGESESESETSSDSDASSASSSSAGSKRKLALPTFIRKDQRNQPSAPAAPSTAHAAAAREEEQEADDARRKETINSLLQEQIEHHAAARAAANRGWDDDHTGAEAGTHAQDEAGVDDTDGLDPELEHAQWVARELARVKRAREALETREAEIAEVERRRNLTAEEREEEDRERMAEQDEARKGRSKMAHLQKYSHRGAFYQDDARAAGLLDRDLMGARFQDQTENMAALPEYLQVRDSTRIGRKGRTRYKDLKTEDTGRWGDYGRGDGRMKREGGYGGATGGYTDIEDDRFKPDQPYGGASDATGANAGALGAKRKQYEDVNRGEDKKPRLEEQR